MADKHILLDSLQDIEARQCSEFYSDIYNRNFQMHKGHTLVKLPPITKLEAERDVDEFAANLPGRILGNSYLAKDASHNEPNCHQFYNLVIAIEGKRTMNIHFRTRANDSVTGTILEYMHEAFVLQGSQGLFIYTFLTGKYNALWHEWRSDYDAKHCKEHESEGFWAKQFRSYANTKCVVILNTVKLMEARGYAVQDVLGTLLRIRVFPLIRNTNDLAVVEKISELWASGSISCGNLASTGTITDETRTSGLYQFGPDFRGKGHNLTKPRIPTHKEQAEYFRVCLAMELITSDVIVSWADSIIAELDKPPVEIIEVCLADVGDPEDVQARLADVSGEGDLIKARHMVCAKLHEEYTCFQISPEKLCELLREWSYHADGIVP